MSWLIVPRLMVKLLAANTATIGSNSARFKVFLLVDFFRLLLKHSDRDAGNRRTGVCQVFAHTHLVRGGFLMLQPTRIMLAPLGFGAEMAFAGTRW